MEAAVEAGFHVFAGDRSNESAKGGPIADDEAVTRIHLDITKADEIAAAVQLVADHVGDSGLDRVSAQAPSFREGSSRGGA